MTVIKNIFYFGIFLFISCKNQNSGNIPPDWAKNISIYEIMPRQYSDKRNLEGIKTDLNRIQGMFFNSICLLPILERDEANNAYNPNSPLAVSSFNKIDPELGDSEKMNELIDSAHHKNIKVFIEWYLTGTGPHHEWRQKNPDYYKSNEKMIDNRYNPDFVNLNCANKSLQKEMSSSVISFLKENHFDGIVFYGLDQYPNEFIKEFTEEVKSVRPLLLINYSKRIIPECHFNVNTDLFQYFKLAYIDSLKADDLKGLIDSSKTFASVHFLQDYILNDRYGPDANLFYNAYKYYHSLTYFLPGIPWVLNGQEDPQFENLNLFSGKPFNRSYKYNNDFYRSLNRMKQMNASLWNFDANNLPVRISESNEVLAMVRTSGNSTVAGFFNLTDHVATYTLNKSFFYYYDVFNKVPVNFPDKTELKLGPYQSMIISNQL